ncbi:hypothetical protein N7467_000653 [Penicillium canescens]|nr:hypothetical protein N7467_000653 [Penicillium canescens]
MAFSIHHVFDILTNEYVRTAVTYKFTSSDWTGGLPAGDLLLSSIRMLNLYEANYGSHLGQVKKFDIPDTRFPGIAWVMPAPAAMQ